MTAFEKAEKYRVQASASEHAPGHWTAFAEILLRGTLSAEEIGIARLIHSGFNTKEEA